MGKSNTQKNQEKLVKQQVTELAKLTDELPRDLLRAAEDRVLKQSLDVLEGVIGFAELGFDEKGQVDENQLPFEWLELSEAERRRRVRLARFGMMNTADIPHGAKMAHAAAVGIIKSRAQEKSGTRILNLELSTFPMPAPLEQQPDAIDADFEVIDIE